jgi:hypothetical protein
VFCLVRLSETLIIVSPRRVLSTVFLGNRFFHVPSQMPHRGRGRRARTGASLRGWAIRRSARSVPMAPSPTRMPSSSFPLRSNKSKPPYLGAYHPEQGRERCERKVRCASSLGVPSAGVGTCHSPREHRIPSNHRLPRLQRASPSTALDEHRLRKTPETIKTLQHDYPGIATLPGLPLPRTRVTRSFGFSRAHAAATRSLYAREVCAIRAKTS